ncbi:MAG: hypothetical protein ACKVOR_11110 [Flavobacteriales bacterium]
MKYIYLLPLVIFCGCLPDNSSSIPSTFQRNKTEHEVRQFFDSYYAAMKAKGLIGELEFLDTTSDFFWVPPYYNSSITFDSVSAHLHNNAHLFQSVENSWEHVRIYPLNDSIATYTGKLHSKMIQPNDSALSATMLESGVVRKRNGHWKLLCGQTCIINEEDK